VVVTGRSESATPGLFDYATVAYDAAGGTRLWAKRYNGPGNGVDDRASAVAVSPNGARVFVTGTSAGTASDDYATIVYDAGTGSLVWLKRRDRGSADAAKALGVSPDGTQLYVTGTIYRTTGTLNDFDTVAYDASNGSRLWATDYNGPANGYEYAMALAVGPAGNKVFVTGISPGTGTAGDDYATIAYSVT
jgi:WD40 repeat protein